MGNILIIGQAPPAVTQKIPYDTTLLYDILSWVNVTKDQAQNMFEFEAMVNSFPGHDANGHKKPDKKEMHAHYRHILTPKIQKAKKVLLLGNVAKENCREFGIYALLNYENIFCLPHPSRRNYSLIMNSKEEIIKKIKILLS